MSAGLTPYCARTSFLSVKMNCPGVSFDDLETFFDPGNFFRNASKSLDTVMSVESFSVDAATSLIPIAFEPGGHPLSAAAMTL